MSSIAEEAKTAGVSIVTGDTKVVEAGKGDGIYINTAGIGFQRADLPGKEGIRPGDAVWSAAVSDVTGAAVMMARSGLLKDRQPAPLGLPALTRVSAAAIDAAADSSPSVSCGIHTRGGIATTLNEFTENMPFSIELDETAIPVDPAVEAACDMLGLDPLYCACEGRMLAICDSDSADTILEAIRQIPGGEDAARIGTITKELPGKVLLKTSIGGRRILPQTNGLQLPRIC